MIDSQRILTGRTLVEGRRCSEIGDADAQNLRLRAWQMCNYNRSGGAHCCRVLHPAVLLMSEASLIISRHGEEEIEHKLGADM